MCSIRLGSILPGRCVRWDNSLIRFRRFHDLPLDSVYPVNVRVVERLLAEEDRAKDGGLRLLVLRRELPGGVRWDRDGHLRRSTGSEAAANLRQPASSGLAISAYGFGPTSLARLVFATRIYSERARQSAFDAVVSVPDPAYL